MKFKVFLFLTCLLQACSPRYSVVTPELRIQMMEDLKNGRTTLNCRFDCSWSWFHNLDRMADLYKTAQWQELAQLVMQIGLEKDLAYFFLARSADQLGHKVAANSFYQRSWELFNDTRETRHCRTTNAGCVGFDLATLIPDYLDNAKSDINKEQKLPHEANYSVSNKTGPLTEKLIKNLSLPINVGDNLVFDIQFIDGDAEGFIVYDDNEKVGFSKIYNYLLGDLNSDGSTDAAILTTTNTGGNGVFDSMIVVLDRSNNITTTNSVYLGLGTSVNNISIKSNKIIIDALVPGPRDGLCCPTKKKQLIFNVNDKKLIQIDPKSGCKRF